MPSEIDNSLDVARITIQPYRGALIASIQIDLEERVLGRFQSDLLECIASSDVRLAIIDLSGVHVMDAEDFNGLRRIIHMTSLMGTKTVLCAMQPGVAAALIDLDVPVDDLTTCRDLDSALEQFALAAPAEEPTSLDEDNGEDALENRETDNGTQRQEALDPE